MVGFSWAGPWWAGPWCPWPLPSWLVAAWCQPLHFAESFAGSNLHFCFCFLFCHHTATASIGSITLIDVAFITLNFVRNRPVALLEALCAWKSGTHTGEPCKDWPCKITPERTPQNWRNIAKIDKVKSAQKGDLATGQWEVGCLKRAL